MADAGDFDFGSPGGAQGNGTAAPAYDLKNNICLHYRTFILLSEGVQYACGTIGRVATVEKRSSGVDEAEGGRRRGFAHVLFHAKTRLAPSFRARRRAFQILIAKGKQCFSR